MPQLYCQLASRPSPWLLGRTSAGLCTLQTACPLTVTYSGGTPTADTIAAGSAATVYGGSAVAFDAGAAVWVVLTVPGSGAVQVVKEADLATVTGDWAGLARIAQHSTEPYQPQAYLGTGGAGTTPSATTTAVTDGSTRVHSLWNGSSNDAPPGGWQDVAFADGGWATGASAALTTGQHPPAGTTAIWASTPPLSTTEHGLVRLHLILPTGVPTAATITVGLDDTLVGATGEPGTATIWVNGTAATINLGTPVQLQNGPGTTSTLPASLFVGGALNIIAFWVANTAAPTAWLGARVSVDTSGGTGGIPSPGGAEGDVLYFHGTQWVGLPPGSSGDVLTSNGTDPAWAAPGSGSGVGTVTSVAFSGPTGTTTGGSPLTTSGTISLAWASQSANVVLASPNGSSGAPAFRALVGADIPVDASTIVSSAGTIKGNYQAGSGVSISGNTIAATGSGGSVTSVALALPAIFSVSGSPVTTSGTLSASLAAQAPHTFWGGPASGSSAAPTFRALQGSDLPAAAGAGGKIHAHGHFT